MGLLIVIKVLDFVYDLCNKLHLSNIWRLLHSEIDHYTRYRTKPLTLSRIDFYLISDKVVDDIESCNIEYEVQLDHSAVLLSYKLNNFKRKPGFWKFNSLLLQEIKTYEFIKSAIEALVWKIQYITKKCQMGIYYIQKLKILD